MWAEKYSFDPERRFLRFLQAAAERAHGLTLETADVIAETQRAVRLAERIASPLINPPENAPRPRHSSATRHFWPGV